eukprot:CAMPEP_0178949960 /NCGR_PEP_ID=MMETSP0789-20121207/6363_1 /TAXON_ID=3005 /ORGANISM="Rhizosolenia setigera, Strain CCMP 1694" /LENGTH=616 /DNA_ID=CAMNT_0020630585 /DNA_START=171 /DNA_END=2021 /DNA_ORIENTATION=+
MKRNYRHTLKATIEENSSSSAEDKKDETKSRESEDEGSGINPKMEDIEANAIDILSLDPSAINIQPVYDDRASVKKRQSVSKPFYENSNIGMNFDTKIPSTPNINEPTKVLSESKFVNMFRSCASYIANHRGSTIVYHVPGEFLEHSDFADLMDDIALTWLLGMKIVLVVGCKHQIESRLSSFMPTTPNQAKASHTTINVRVTNLSTLRVVKEEAGYARFEVERQLTRALRLHRVTNQGGGNVISGNFYSAQPFGVVDGIDYQYTGLVRKVDVEKINQIHQSNDIVLLTALGFSPSGEVFNVNSEALAASVSGQLKAKKLLFLTNFRTELTKQNANQSIIQSMRLKDARQLLNYYQIEIQKRGYVSINLEKHEMKKKKKKKKNGKINGHVDEDKPVKNNDLRDPHVLGTLLKLGWSVDALEKGVKRVHIVSPTNGALLNELYTRDGSGLLVSRDLYEGIRRADVNDIAGVFDLINPLVQAGVLVPRPKNQLEKDINTYYVYTRDELIVATGQLKRFEGGFAEIGCLVVHKDYRKGGRGDAILGFLERVCVRSGIESVFVLSTQTMEWFVERGFREVPVSSLPPSRQETYNRSRRSKVYMKKLSERFIDEEELIWDR